MSSLIEIDAKIDLRIEVKEAYNERGIYILNDKYFIGSDTPILKNVDKLNFKDPALWRPKGSEFTPSISDIPAPFILEKQKNGDYLILIIANDTLFLKLEKEEE